MAVNDRTPAVNERKEIIEDIINRVEARGPAPSALLSAGSGRNDIDLFGILSDDGQFRQPLNNLFASIAEVQRNRIERGVLVTVFPSFRTKTADKVLSEMNAVGREIDEVHQLHLLLYPTYELFVEWEDPMLVQRVARSSDVLIGDEEKLAELSASVSTPPLAERVMSANLLSILVDNQQTLRCGQYPEDVLLEEVTDKTVYVVRYLTFDHLLEAGHELSDLLSWRQIHKRRESCEEPIPGICETAYEWWRTDSVGERSELGRINDECLSVVEEIVSR